MPDRQILPWLTELFACIDRKDINGFSCFLADDVQFRFGNLPVTQGKALVANQVASFFDSIQALHHHIEQAWSQGDRVTCYGRVSYTRHDGSKLNVPFANIFKTDARGIREYLIFADIAALYQSS